MRVSQWIAVGILGLVSSVASAVPVRIDLEYWIFDHGFGLQTDPTDLTLGDETCLGCPNEWFYEHELSNGLGTAATSAYGRMDAHSTSTRNSFAYDVTLTLEAYASVDASLPDGRAYAEADSWGFYAWATVFEPVIFTGSRGFYVDGRELASGALLRPGEYEFSIGLLRPIYLTAQAGETFRSSATKSGRYNLIAVPTPTTGLMLLTALGGLLAVRARDRRRKVHAGS